MRVRLLTPALATGLTLILALSACGGDDDGGSKGSLVVGSAGFTESQVMAEMYALLLDDAGYDASVKTVQNRELYEPALEKGEIDVVPEYAATMAEFLNRAQNGADAAPVASSDVDKTMTALRDLGGKAGLDALEPSKAVDQNAFAVTEKLAQSEGLATMSDLAKLGRPLTLAATAECPERPFCQPGLEKVYGLKISKVEPLGFSTPQVKEAVKSGKTDLGLVATTDGTLADFGLVVLEDDKGLQNADNLVPVVNAKSAGSSEVADALNALAPVLTTEDLAELNKKVDVERQKAADVAEQYLKDKGLI